VSCDRMWNLACLFVGDVLGPVQRPRTKPCCKGRKNLASHYQGTRRRAVNVSDLSSARIYMISQHNLEYCFAAQISSICSKVHLQPVDIDLRLVMAQHVQSHPCLGVYSCLRKLEKLNISRPTFCTRLRPRRLMRLSPIIRIAVRKIPSLDTLCDECINPSARDVCDGSGGERNVSSNLDLSGK
jgi:hypothetical protein